MADHKPDPIESAVTEHYADAFLDFQKALLVDLQGRVPRLLRGALVGLPEPLLRRFAQKIAAGITLALQMHTEQLLADGRRDAA